MLRIERENEYKRQGLKVEDDRGILSRVDNKPKESLGSNIVKDVQVTFEKQLAYLKQ